MKAGISIVLGLVIWFAASLSNSLWVYQGRVHNIALLIIIVSSIIWLINKANRENLRQAFSSKRLEVNQEFAGKLGRAIRIGIIAGFALIATVIQSSKILLEQSEGFKAITDVIRNDREIRSRVGEVKFVAVYNRAGMRSPPSGKGKTWRASIIVFGRSEEAIVEVVAIKSENWLVREMKIKE
jgi:hypothetical protein